MSTMDRLDRQSDPVGRSSSLAAAGDQTLRGSTRSRTQGQARHPCSRCGMVYIPDGRLLCHYCTRTVALSGVAIRCPACPGNINDPGHFMTIGHMRAVGPIERSATR